GGALLRRVPLRPLRHGLRTRRRRARVDPGPALARALLAPRAHRGRAAVAPLLRLRPAVRPARRCGGPHPVLSVEARSRGRGRAVLLSESPPWHKQPDRAGGLPSGAAAGTLNDGPAAR